MAAYSRTGVRGPLKVPCNLNHSIIVNQLCCLMTLRQERSVGWKIRVAGSSW